MRGAVALGGRVAPRPIGALAARWLAFSVNQKRHSGAAAPSRGGDERRPRSGTDGRKGPLREKRPFVVRRDGLSDHPAAREYLRSPFKPAIEGPKGRHVEGRNGSDGSGPRRRSASEPPKRARATDREAGRGAPQKQWDHDDGEQVPWPTREARPKRDWTPEAGGARRPRGAEESTRDRGKREWTPRGRDGGEREWTPRGRDGGKAPERGRDGGEREWSPRGRDGGKRDSAPERGRHGGEREWTNGGREQRSRAVDSGDSEGDRPAGKPQWTKPTWSADGTSKSQLAPRERKSFQRRSDDLEVRSGARGSEGAWPERPWAAETRQHAFANKPGGGHKFRRQQQDAVRDSKVGLWEDAWTLASQTHAFTCQPLFQAKGSLADMLRTIRWWWSEHQRASNTGAQVSKPYYRVLSSSTHVSDRYALKEGWKAFFGHYMRINWLVEQNPTTLAPRPDLLWAAYAILLKNADPLQTAKCVTTTIEDARALSSTLVAMCEGGLADELDDDASPMPVPVRLECPPLYWQALVAQWGEERTRTELAAMKEPLPIQLRANTLKGAREFLQHSFSLI